MEETAALRQTGADEREPRVRLLIADDDRAARSLLASSVCDVVGEIVVFEADDGAEAIRLGLQQSPEIALLDINMPRLGGIEAATTLRELRPRMRLALHSGDPHAHRERAFETNLPLFGKLELDRTLAWLQAQVERCREARSPQDAPRKRSFVCGSCGYGAFRAAAPDRCPVCHAENTWIVATRQAPTVLSARG